MTLYTEPPTGIISYQKLETFALKRLDFLLKVKAARGDLTKLNQIVCDPENVVDSDCLIIGSVKDKVSHFILRLLMGGDPESQQFFQNAETAWFDFKFSCMSEDEMIKFFHSVDKVLKKSNLYSHRPNKPVTPGVQSITSILEVFRSIKQYAGSWKEVVRLYMTQCSTSQFCVPFQSVWGLLGKRRVELHRGMAKVPFSKLREVTTEQFSSLMQLAVVQASRQFPGAVTDDRLRLLWRKLKLIYRRQLPDVAFLGFGSMPGLSLEQVDAMAEHYPLCMATLLRSLRQRHRLGHHARIQLTLFLKDLGLPVHHALALWQQEYSRPSGPGSTCTHSWQTDGRRYTYSIRHLYGLEGARRNYQSHCCDSLQQCIVGCNEGGGCPFSVWDNKSLSAELAVMGLHSEDVENILSLCGRSQFSAACHQSLQITKSKSVQKESVCNEGSDQHSKHLAGLQACHQVTISTNPGSMYRTDCIMNQVCDVEDLVNMNKMSSLEKTKKIASCKGSRLGVTVPKTETAENRQSIKSCRPERSCHNKRGADVCEHMISKTDICPHTTSVAVCEQATSKPFQLQLEQGRYTYSCSNHEEQSGEHLKDTKEQYTVETKNQVIQCFDHDVCPSQSGDKSMPHSFTKASSCPTIFRPVQYVHVSYQCMLQSLKTCASDSKRGQLQDVKNV